MTDALIVDTGGWLVALDGTQPHADAIEGAAVLLVPALVLPEMDYFLRRRRERMQRLLKSIGGGEYEFQPPTREDLIRAVEIDQKFKSMNIGLVDASIAALAERTGVKRVLTIDSHFSAIRIGKKYDTALEVVGGPL